MARSSRMARQWPPSPSVEDEEVALAHEHHNLRRFKGDELPAGSRGSVDQYPVILDIGDKATTTADENSGISSDESLGPPTPTHTRTDQRFIHIPTTSSNPATSFHNVPPPQEAKKDSPRGRPNVSRIQTDMAGDLQEMITGRRRAPSPYAYAPAQKAEKIERGNQFAGECLLSPKHANLPILDTKRASSARPRIKTDDLDSSTDSDRRSDRRRHHSRKRSTREPFSRTQHLEANDPPRPALNDHRASSYSGASPEPGLLHKALHKEDRGIGALEQHGRTAMRGPKDSPYTSSAEETKSSIKHQYSPRANNKSSHDSPYTSSADESKSKRRDIDSGSPRSRPSSIRKKDRPHLDLQDHHYSYGGGQLPDDKHDSETRRKDVSHHPVYDGRGYLEPSSLRSPRAVEDYLEKAFKDNKTSNSDINLRPSPCASPRASPPETPPKTPRTDRRSKDYFGLGVSQPIHAPIHRSRPSSREENLYKDVKPLTAALAATGIGKVAAGFAPNSSRSSPSLTEKPLSVPTNKTQSNWKSRNSSPKTEDLRPISRTGSFAQGEVRPVSRTSTFPLAERRSISRNGSYAPPQDESPRVSQRTLSYSSTDEHPHQRPSPSPRTSQGNFMPVTGTEAPLSSASRPMRSSHSSSEKVPQTAASNGPSRALAPCPRSKPVSGFSDWYTLKELPELDICPSCMGSLGNSRFRDSFVPSLAKPRTQEVRCALSKPWIRNAWIQVLKQHRRSLDMIYQLIHLPPTTKPCPGRKGEVRSWYRIIDPDTGDPVPNFEACSACVRSVELIFPQLRGILKRSTSLVERTCDLNCDSKRFVGYMSQMDLAAMRFDVERLREPKIQALADHARRTARVRECRRDDKIRSQPWHFMPQLPEFTICEECFQDVVWPVIDKPIAKSINRTLQMVPATRDGHHASGISCQLYSDRMRRTFVEAVQYSDYDLLRSVATRRYGVERLLQENHQLYLRDMAMGKDRAIEMQNNIMKWREWE